MTEQEAIERLKCMKLFMQISDKDNESKFLDEDYEANAMAIKALEKQIPKEPFRGYIPRDLATNCGNCNSFIGFSDQTNRYIYCPYCGQAIKWE